MGKKVPLFVYDSKGNKRNIGEAEIHEDHISLDVTDEEVSRALTDDNLEHLSIGEEVQPKRRNVFDKDKD